MTEQKPRMTSQQWWDIVKNDEALLMGWLIKQYRGEVTAANRIRDMARHFSETILVEHRHTLEDIAHQESRHAQWIAELMVTRGMVVSTIDLSMAELRYWATVSPSITTFETACAIGAHAEKMRLERIEVICNDLDTPVDIAITFRGILREEKYHAKAFAWMAGPVAMQTTQATADLGREVLGLVA